MNPVSPETIDILVQAGGQLWEKRGQRRIWAPLDVLLRMADAVVVHGSLSYAIGIGDVILAGHEIGRTYTRLSGLDLNTGEWTLSGSPVLDSHLLPALEAMIASPELAAKAADREHRRILTEWTDRQVAELGEAELLKRIAEDYRLDGRNAWAWRASMVRHPSENLITRVLEVDDSTECVENLVRRQNMKEETIRTLTRLVDGWWEYKNLCSQPNFPVDVFLELRMKAVGESNGTTRRWASSEDGETFHFWESTNPVIFTVMRNSPAERPRNFKAPVSGVGTNEDCRLSASEVDVIDERLPRLARDPFYAKALLPGLPYSTAQFIGPKTYAVLLEWATENGELLRLVEQNLILTTAEQLEEWSTRRPCTNSPSGPQNDAAFVHAVFENSDLLDAIVDHHNVSTETLQTIANGPRNTTTARARRLLMNRVTQSDDSDTTLDSYGGLVFYFGSTLKPSKVWDEVLLTEVLTTLRATDGVTRTDYSDDQSTVLTEKLELVRKLRTDYQEALESVAFTMTPWSPAINKLDLRQYRTLETRLAKFVRDMGIIRQRTESVIELLRELEGRLTGLREAHSRLAPALVITADNYEW